MSISELAKEIGVSGSSLHQWISTDATPTFKNQRIIYKYFQKRAKLKDK